MDTYHASLQVPDTEIQFNNEAHHNHCIQEQKWGATDIEYAKPFILHKNPEQA